MFSEFHFLRPLWLLALLPLLFLLWRWIRMQRSGGLWEKVIDPALIKHVMKSHSVGVRQFWSPVVFGLIAVLLIVAMAGPVWQRWPQPVYGTQDPLVVVLDLSRSMDAGDTKPNRLTRARHKIRDLLRRRPDGQTALIVYAAQAFVVTPLTQDTDTIASLVPVLETDLMPEQGTRPDLALEEARELLTQSDAGPGHVLLITDGIDGVDIDEILDDLKQAGHRVSVLGVGTVAGAPIPSQSGGFITDKSGEVVVTKLNTEELRKVAERGQGGFQILGAGNSDLLALLQNMAAREVGEVQAGLKTDVWREEGPWLLLAALPLVALAFRRGVIPIVLLVICLPLAQPSHALEWRDLWRTKDQQGADAMAEENPEVAAELFDNPNWKAVAKYHNGDYADSAELWSNDTTVTAHYNRGNALARQGPQYFDEAIASYDQALDLDPDHEDA
ncbi:MAG: VWA domain-containing protein, partial [Pseudomonadota bacterium]